MAATLPWSLWSDMACICICIQVPTYMYMYILYMIPMIPMIPMYSYAVLNLYWVMNNTDKNDAYIVFIH